MEDDEIIIFVSVINRVIGSFAQIINDAIFSYEDKVRNLDQKNRNEILIRLFDDFPRDKLTYKESINTLISVGSPNVNKIQLYITSIFEDVITNDSCALFASLKTMSHVYNKSNPYHKQLLLNFCCFFISDLLFCYINKYGPSESSNKTIDIGFSMCRNDSVTPWLHPNILNQWSMIFSLISEEYYLKIYDGFESCYNNGGVVKYIFHLISLVNLESKENVEGKSILDNILKILVSLREEKLLTNKILHYVSRIVLYGRQGATMDKIFEFIWGLKDNKKMKDGVYDLLASLFIKIDTSEKRKSIFLRKRVFLNAGDTKKVERSIYTFRRLMFGTNAAPRWLFWNWDLEKPDHEICYIKWNCENRTVNEAPQRFVNIFYKYFFKKADFSVAPGHFVHCIVHLASLDFRYFFSNLVHYFMDLDPLDHRFTAFMGALVYISSDYFLENSCCKCSKDSINKLMELAKPKVTESFLSSSPKTEIPSVSIRHIDFEMDYELYHANLNIPSTFQEWDFQLLDTVNPDFHIADDKRCEFTRDVQIVKCMEALSTIEELCKSDNLKVILNLTAHENEGVLNSAKGIWLNTLNDEALRVKVASFLIKKASMPLEKEFSFTYIDMLIRILQNTIHVRTTVFHDIEFIGLLGLISENPMVRSRAYRLLSLVNLNLNGKGFSTFIQKELQVIEDTVTKRSIRYKYLHTFSPVKPIEFKHAIHSRCAEIWSLFVSEIVSIIIASNYTPLLSRIQEKMVVFFKYILKKKYTRLPSVVNTIVLFFSQYYDQNLLLGTPSLYNLDTYEPFSQPHQSSEAFIHFKQLFEINHSLAIQSLPYIHFSLCPQMLTILEPQIDRVEDTELIAKSMMLLIASPAISSSLIQFLIPPLFSILRILQSKFVMIGINGPRVIVWTDKLENECYKYSGLITMYCNIFITCFTINHGQITEDLWPVPYREIVFRHFMNWSFTRSKNLETVRDMSKNALKLIMLTGRVFNDILIIDERVLDLFSNIEFDGERIIGNIVYFHADIILNIIIECCYNRTQTVANIFFESVFSCFDEQYSDNIYKNTGSLLLLGSVYWVLNHPKARSFFELMVDFVLKKRSQSARNNIGEVVRSAKSLRDIIPSCFPGTSENVVHAGLRVIGSNKRVIATNFVVEPLLLWLEDFKLFYVQGSSDEFSHISPIQFLSLLRQITENLEDEFATIAKIWLAIYNIPDHQDLVQQYILTIENHILREKLISFLIYQNGSAFLKKIITRTSFAYFYYVVECSKEDYTKELWLSSVLIKSVDLILEDLTEYLPMLINWCFLFPNHLINLLEMICSRLNIYISAGTFGEESITYIIESICSIQDEKFSQLISAWSDDSLKWAIGSKNIRISTTALFIYNQIGKSVNIEVFDGITGIVSYHLSVEENITKASNLNFLKQLVRESFKFFAINFNVSPKYVFDYLSSFIDSPLFAEESLHEAAQLFILLISSNVTKELAWPLQISFIRLLLPSLETEVKARMLFQLLIKNTYSDELMCVILPFKMIRFDLFSDIDVNDDFIEKCSSSVLNNVLSHYTIMTKTASIAFLNQIFRVTNLIVQKIGIGYSKSSLTGLYKIALNYVTSCPCAVELISVIAKHEQSILSKQYNEYYGWSRSFEDVRRAVSKLTKPKRGNPSATWFSSVQQVIELDHYARPPRVIPFSNNKEQLDHNKELDKVSLTQRRLLLNRKHRPEAKSPPGSPRPKKLFSAYFDQSGEDVEIEVKALKHPRKLLESGTIFQSSNTIDVLYPATEFLASE